MAYKLRSNGMLWNRPIGIAVVFMLVMYLEGRSNAIRVSWWQKRQKISYSSWTLAAWDAINSCRISPLKEVPFPDTQRLKARKMVS